MLWFVFHAYRYYDGIVNDSYMLVRGAPQHASSALNELPRIL
ncbi:hypothetical protein BCEP4_700011 [Burkholderia cepacia]|nr:hypothetical protein BCEP4_700011 [Burkholderia cepacia]